MEHSVWGRFLPRERQTLELYLNGEDEESIAEAIGRSTDEVRGYLRGALLTLLEHNTSELSWA